MVQAIGRMIKGFIFLTLIAGGCGMVKDLASRATNAHKVGLVSYSKYTKMLTKKNRVAP